ncbi:TRAP transporter permease [Jannaschia sp. 2305UL9-9]|uniref:TRAP transporter permease n=1 Tax=Jannaschia sp. 2305UL9-9 TaxID=3121638 RepID=UPI0035275E4C
MKRLEFSTDEDGPEIHPTSLPGRIGKAVLPWLGILIALVGLVYTLDVFVYLNVFLYSEQFFALLYGLVFAAGFLSLPVTKGRREAGASWIDMGLAVVGIAVGLYFAISWDQIVRTAGLLTTERTVISTIAILLVLELTRRAFGMALVILTGLFMAYALFNYMIPGPFGGRGTSWARLSSYVVTDTSALLGMISSVVFGMVFAFLLFGRALFMTGGGTFFTEVSMALMGHHRGGPAKVAIVASGLFGSLSGSASGNVVVTGTITIPMMIRSGFRRSTAGAVEAVASSGGSLLPPIMGATAFVMAEFLQVPYYEIALAALVPALLYYAAVFIQVDLESGRLGLRGLPQSELPRMKDTLIRGWTFLIPLAALIYCLFVIFLSPTKSALLATLVVLLVSFIGPVRTSLAMFVDILRATGQGMVQLGLVAAIAGVILGIINLTGVGLLISQQVLSLAGGNLFILLVLTALTSIVLGMSMPVTASYVILSVLAAPALTEAGVEPLAAHLFVLYFAVLSFLTPPVCVAVFVAATIAKAPPMETAWQSMKLAVVAYIVPFVFVVDPGLLLIGAPAIIVLNIVSALMGLGAISVGLVGHARGPVPPVLRGAMIVLGVGSFMPDPMISIAAMLAVAAMLGVLLMRKEKAAKAV